ncbi:MAG: hypothetical protein ACI9UV_001826 [Algoriphagus sp.]|jgi:hypothetical protein
MGNMKNKFKIISLVFFILVSNSLQAQVLISLLFGDALNSERIEFGLTGGLNRSYLNNYNDSDGLNNFNLGFYFNIKLQEKSFLSTGVYVKNKMGATGMPVYLLNDPEFDEVFKDGTLTTKINYFYVPIMYQQRINNRFLIEGGIQAGLRTKAYDFFRKELLDGDAEFKNEVSDDFARLDFGVVGGMGYKLKKDPKSMSVGFLYYSGLVDAIIIPNVSAKNSSLNFYIRIPIGANKDPAVSQ